MSSLTTASQKAAKDFFQAVKNGDRNAGFPFQQLQKGNLSDFAEFGGAFFRTLDVANARFSEAPNESTTKTNASLVADAITHFGIAWEPALLQGEGFASLEKALQTAMEAKSPLMAFRVVRALAHLSPFLEHSQVKAVATIDTTDSLEHKHYDPTYDLNELVLASPRQLLLHTDPSACFHLKIDNSLVAASEMLRGLKDQVSGCDDGRVNSLEDQIIFARQSVSSIALLIPEISKIAGELPNSILAQFDALVDSLTWVVEARNRVEAVAYGRVLVHESPRVHATLFEKLREIRDHCWLGLAMLLDPKALWADRYNCERNRLKAIALKKIERDRTQGWSHRGRLPLELFLVAVDPNSAGEKEFINRINVRICDQLARYQAEEFLSPGYVDGVTAAAVAWSEELRPPHESTDFAEVLRELSRAALRGRAFLPDAQAFLVRSIHMEDKT